MRSMVLFALALPGWAALAAPNDNDSGSSAGVAEDADFAAGRKAFEAGDWQAMTGAFNKVVAKDPGNANAHNFLGYAYRKSGKLDLAFKHYEEALRIDPRHRGAHEYIGETYLLTNNLAKAEEHLKALDGICTFGCAEYSDLKKAVAEYKRNNAKS
ncbi:MAG: tetratricopeptide repeat protein [Burkholderiales bacterium]|nr:tetratricopeptide repeat protein [Burkholderiales bacterium]